MSRLHTRIVPNAIATVALLIALGATHRGLALAGTHAQTRQQKPAPAGTAPVPPPLTSGFESRPRPPRALAYDYVLGGIAGACMPEPAVDDAMTSRVIDPEDGCEIHVQAPQIVTDCPLSQDAVAALLRTAPIAVDRSCELRIRPHQVESDCQVAPEEQRALMAAVSSRELNQCSIEIRIAPVLTECALGRDTVVRLVAMSGVDLAVQCAPSVRRGADSPPTVAEVVDSLFSSTLALLRGCEIFVPAGAHTVLGSPNTVAVVGHDCEISSAGALRCGKWRGPGVCRHHARPN